MGSWTQGVGVGGAKRLGGEDPKVSYSRVAS